MKYSRLPISLVFILTITACNFPDALGRATSTVVPPQETSTAPLSKSRISPENVKTLEISALLTQTSASDMLWLPELGIVLATETEISFYSPAFPKAFNQPATVDQAQAEVPAEVSGPIAIAAQKYLAWSTEEPLVHLWNISEHRELHQMGVGTAQVTGLAFSPDARLLAGATADNVLRIWDSASGQPIKEWQARNWLSNLVFSPDGKYLAGVELPEFKAHLFNPDTGETYTTLQWSDSASPALYSAIFSPGWNWLAWVARGEVQVMHLPGGELGPLFTHEDFVNAVAWSPDERILATTAAGTLEEVFVPLVYLWDVESGKLLHVFAMNESVVSLAFSPDGLDLAILLVSGQLSIWSVLK